MDLCCFWYFALQSAQRVRKKFQSAWEYFRMISVFLLKTNVGIFSGAISLQDVYPVKLRPNIKVPYVL